MENVSVKKQYIMDGHGSVTALAESRESEDGAVVSGITNTYVYDAYGNLLKQTGTTENDYLYANLVMYTDSSGYFLLAETGVAQDAGSFVEAVKGGEPKEIIFETLRLVISLFTLRSQCFVENTLVSTVEGEKRIDEIEIGDYVWSYDTKTDNKVATEVTNILVSKTDVLVYVILSDGKEIKTTLYHPFYVKNGETGEWKAASNLESGDLLLSEDGAIIFVKDIKVVREDRKITVYNLEIGEQHIYFVEDRVLVHNSCTESPPLTDNPYNPDVVENRIKTKYVSNSAHD